MEHVEVPGVQQQTLSSHQSLPQFVISRILYSLILTVCYPVSSDYIINLNRLLRARGYFIRSGLLYLVVEPSSYS